MFVVMACYDDTLFYCYSTLAILITATYHPTVSLVRKLDILRSTHGTGPSKIMRLSWRMNNIYATLFLVFS